MDNLHRDRRAVTLGLAHYHRRVADLQEALGAAGLDGLLILNAANLNLVAFERFGPAPLRGTVFAIFVLAVAAAEAAIALAIVLNVFDARDEIDVDETTALKG